MDNTDTIFDAGLSFTCDFDKPIPFIGQEQVMEQQTRIQKEGGRRKRLVSVFVTDPDPMLHHGEILYRKDQAVADIRAGTYGHTLGGSVGLAMLQDDHLFINSDYIGTGDWKVRVGNESYPVRLSFKPLYDPKGLRVTAA
jgi:4-methylaminobutanoate oxidase (formaldehyde-forming)